MKHWGLDPLQASRIGQDVHWRKTTEGARTFCFYLLIIYSKRAKKGQLPRSFRFPEGPEFSPELTIYLVGVVLSVVESQLTVTGYIHPWKGINMGDRPVSSQRASWRESIWFLQSTS